MHTVVLVASRHRGWNKPADNISLITSLLSERSAYYGADLTVASIGCDHGFGKDVKDYCEEHGIKFVEYVVYFNGPRDKSEYEAAYKARHAALLDIGVEFHMLVSNNRRTTVEDLVERVQRSAHDYAIYDESNHVIESRCQDTVQAEYGAQETQAAEATV